MTISNDQYTQALQVIAEREAQSALDSLAIITHIQDAIKPCVEDITTVRSAFPAANFATQSTTRMQIENLYNQATSFISQLGYIQTSLESAKAQYDQNTTQTAPAAQ